MLPTPSRTCTSSATQAPAWQPLAEALAAARIPLDPAQHEGFRRYAHVFSVANVSAVCAIGVAVTPVFWLTDPLLVPDAIVARFALYRAGLIAVGLAGLVALRFVPVLRAHPTLLLVLVIGGYVVAGATPAAPLLGFEHRYVDTGHALGVATITLLVPLRKRIPVALGLSGGWLAYLAVLVPSQSPVLFGSYGVALAVFTLIGIVAGHVLYVISRLFYVRSEQLRVLNETLGERVAAQTRDLQRLTDRQTAVLEQERIRVARDLHDETGQLVQGMRFELDLLGMQQASLAPGAGLGRLHSLLDRLLDSIRRILRDLRPQLLDDLGLAAALHALLDEFEAGPEGPRVERDIDESVRLVEPAIGMALYRIAQEALTNVGRHARALMVEVRLHWAGAEAIVLEVADDGIGLPEDAHLRGRVGLIGMRERAQVVGGDLRIAAREPQGTSVRVSTPIVLRSHHP
jgi:signal transduction histidine kinase